MVLCIPHGVLLHPEYIRRQYSAPVINALPSLSTDGALDLAPRYRSSKLSKLAAADEADDDAELALADAALALLVADNALMLADEAAD